MDKKNNLDYLEEIKDEILKSFDEKRDLYSQFESSMNSLVHALLSKNEINIHSISSRVKDKSSLAKKIEEKTKYQALEDITDVLGMRIITHYSDEVDDVAEIIRNEFKVDEKNSIDKRKTLEPDRFGYLSLHYIVELKDYREKLPEYNSYKSLKFEIQIRSILQHTWAEIEHDIGYKSSEGLPKHMVRKFSQLASVLELADERFLDIKRGLSSYEHSSNNDIQNNPKKLYVDAISIFNFIKNDPTLFDIEKKVAKILNIKLNVIDKRQAGYHLKHLNFFQIETIYDLQEYLKENEDYILERVKDSKEDSSRPEEGLPQGIAISYLSQVLAAKLESKEELNRYLKETYFGMFSPESNFGVYLTEFISKVDKRLKQS